MSLRTETRIECRLAYIKATPFNFVWRANNRLTRLVGFGLARRISKPEKI